jgi:hypothetical protein
MIIMLTTMVELSMLLTRPIPLGKQELQRDPATLNIYTKKQRQLTFRSKYFFA